MQTSLFNPIKTLVKLLSRIAEPTKLLTTALVSFQDVAKEKLTKATFNVLIIICFVTMGYLFAQIFVAILIIRILEL